MTILGAQEPVHPMLQFAWSLSESTDPHAQLKVALIITGRVWGVDSSRSANGSERGVYFTLIGKAKANGVSREAFTPTTPDTKTAERSHQLYLAMAYEVIAVTAAGATGAPPFINYVTDRRAFRVATRDVSVHLAVRHDNWGGLARDLPADTIAQLRAASRLGGPTRIQLLSRIVALPENEATRAHFANSALILLCAGDDLYNNAVLQALSKLQTSAQRTEFAWRLSQMRQGTASSDAANDQFIQQLQQLYGISGVPSAEELEAVANLVTIPRAERASLVRLVGQLLPAGTTAAQKLEAMQMLATISIGEWAERIKQMMQLAKYHRLDRQLEVLGVLSTIPAGELEACIEHMMQLAKYHGLDRQLEVLRILIPIPAGERGACIEQMMQLAKYHVLDRQLEILGILSTIPAGERAAYVAQAGQLPLTLHNATPVVKLAAARIIVEAPSGQGEQFSAQLLEFDSRGDIIVIFGGMADHATRQSIVVQVLRICTPTTPREDRIKVVKLLKEMSPAVCQTFANQVTRFSPLAAYQTNGWEIIQSVARVQEAHRTAFVTFVLRNGVTQLEHIRQLSQVPNPRDWDVTWAGIRGGGAPAPAALRLNGQTSHEAEQQRSIDESVARLEIRYGGRQQEDLDTIVAFYISTIADLVSKGLLSETEGEVAQHFLERGILREGDARKPALYLNLAWHALHDVGVAGEVGAGDFTDKDINDRVAGWVRAGPIDAQLAYLLDRLGGDRAGVDFATKESLLAAIGRDKSILTRVGGRSCVGGSYNRLIDGLQHIHPDVVLVEGPGARQNRAMMARDQFLQNALKAFLQQKYKETPTLFDDVEDLKATAQIHLQALVEIDAQLPHSDFAGIVVGPEIDRCLEFRFEDAIRQATPLKVIHDYLRDTDTGLIHDLRVWAAGQSHLSLSSVEQAFAAQADDLTVGKLALLTETPSAEDAAAIRADATRSARTAAVHHRQKVYQRTALTVMSRVPMVGRFSAAKAALVDLVTAELKRGGVDSDALRVEIDGSILEDDGVREQLEAKVTG
jgi:hypothetical protein